MAISDDVTGADHESPGAQRAWTQLVRTPGGVIGLLLFTCVVLSALLAGAIAPNDPFTSVGAPLEAPSSAHVMGTDDLGRDLLGLVVHGTRTSLLIAFGVAVLAGAIAVVVGTVAGFHPGIVDDTLMRGTELVQVVPRFFLAVVVVALFGPGLDNLIVLLGLTSWTWTARVVRAEVLALRRRDFVEAARAVGASDVRIVVRHIAPNMAASTAVMLSVVASSAILIEAGLGFVGLTDPDVVSLGYLASNAQRFLRSAWWLGVFPGAAITATILAIGLIGDAIGDALDARRAM